MPFIGRPADSFNAAGRHPQAGADRYKAAAMGTRWTRALPARRPPLRPSRDAPALGWAVGGHSGRFVGRLLARSSASLRSIDSSEADERASEPPDESPSPQKVGRCITATGATAAEPPPGRAKAERVNIAAAL